MNFAAARANMVESQIRPNGITDQRIVAAMGAVAREAFVPQAMAAVAYMDEDVPLAGGRWLMEPMAFARLVQLAGIMPADRVLHVGAATGYGTAVLARLAAHVTACEPDAVFASAAMVALAGQNVANASVEPVATAKGLFDVIVVEGRVAEVPGTLVQQLADGGRLVAVVGVNAVSPAMLYVNSNGSISSRAAFDASVAVLPGIAPSKAAAFVF